VNDVVSGLEVLVTRRSELILGQKIGIVTNDGAIDRVFNHIVDLVRAIPGVQVVRLFAAEHGIRGEAQAGARVEDGIDAVTNIPVQSIYGPRFWPTDDALADIDSLLFDMPDVGTRYYTRATTMIYCLRTAARNGKRFIVLDRPNPIGGKAIEGPILQPGFESFVGLVGLPIRHGLTPGEIARLFDAEEHLDADLVIVPAEGCQRSTWYDQTGLPWITPSPNLPTLDTATVYPGTCLIEGTNLSEGRGTTRPFELIGAPWIDPDRLAAELNPQMLPGVHFRPVYFRPVAHKHAETVCGGVQVHVVHREVFRPVLAGVALVLAVERLWPEEFAWRSPASGGIAHIERLAGGTWLREAVNARADARDVAATWRDDEARFASRREEFLLYC
jgi:uncharacterized protein YbbC (DUF1343 family)